MTRKLSLAVALAASLLVAACGGGESGTISINLLHEDCLGSEVFGSAQAIEVTVRGPGLDGEPVFGNIASKQLDLGEIPAGKDREVTVRAVTCAAATGGCQVASVWAIGRSAKFEVVADQSQDIDVPMVGLNRVRPTAGPDNQCTTASARAGHSLAAFEDGRALLVGGFVVNEETAEPGDIVYLDTVEMYEPATGAFRTLDPIPPICGPSGDQTCERAFAPAVVQKNAGKERLLVIGGEYQDPETGALLARGEILVYEPATGSWSTIALQKARRHHTATLLENGTVLIVGGFGNPADETEPVPVVGEMESMVPAGKNTVIVTSGKSNPTPVLVPRALHGAAAFGNEVFVAGGVSESVITERTAYPLEVLRVSASSSAGSPGSLAGGVIGPSVVVQGVGGSGYVVVVGGIKPRDDGLPQGKDVSRLLADLPMRVGLEGTAGGGRVIPLDDKLPSQTYPLKIDRSFACAVPIDETRTLVVGGSDGLGSVVSSPSLATAEVLTWVDKSSCKPRTCEVQTQCDVGTTCTGGACRLACTADADCGKKGWCMNGYCATDLNNPEHRCANGAALGCFAGSECSLDGKLELSYINGTTHRDSGLLTDRAWAACTKLSSDQILITGGLSEANKDKTLGAAEIYEIMHAGR
jgi:hypothetical protein